jgi:ribonuclease T2
MRRLAVSFIVFAALCCASKQAPAQQADSTPGKFDFYLLNLSWSPEFCDTLKTLTPAEQSARTGTTCNAPHAFVLHGLWPQNFDGTYTASCSQRPGPRTWDRYLDMTPDLDLLKHEWFKHGTCTTLSPDAFFSTARQAYTSVVIPDTFKHVNAPMTLAPLAILTTFYRANPSFPQGSFAVACSGGRFVAIEACFSRGVQPIACQNVRSCNDPMVTVSPEAAGQIVR